MKNRNNRVPQDFNRTFKFLKREILQNRYLLFKTKLWFNFLPSVTERHAENFTKNNYKSEQLEEIWNMPNFKYTFRSFRDPSSFSFCEFNISLIPRPIDPLNTHTVQTHCWNTGSLDLQVSTKKPHCPIFSFFKAQIILNWKKSVQPKNVKFYLLIASWKLRS